MCRVLSIAISVMAEGSVIADVKNDGKMYDKVPAEWQTFLHFLPLPNDNHPESF